MLREQAIMVADDRLLPVTIREYLSMGLGHVDDRRLWAALAEVGLDVVVAELPGGLDARLEPTGAPLSPRRRIRLKLARVWVAHPKIVLIDRVLDDLVDAPDGPTLARRLCDPVRPWAVVLVSDLPGVRAHCTQTWRLDRPQEDPR